MNCDNTYRQIKRSANNSRIPFMTVTNKIKDKKKLKKKKIRASKSLFLSFVR